MVEQGTHKPLVVGSNPTLATFNPHLGVFGIIRKVSGEVIEMIYSNLDDEAMKPQTYNK